MLNIVQLAGIILSSTLATAFSSNRLERIFLGTKTSPNPHLKQPLVLFSSVSCNLEEPITNCHVHLMTLDDIPPGWPSRGLHSIGQLPPFRWLLRLVPSSGIPFVDNDVIERYRNFLIHGTSDKCQDDTWKALLKAYENEKDSKFVVLPMDMRSWDPNHSPEHTLIQQHIKLAELTNEFPNRIIPFVHVDPRMPAKDENDHELQPVDFIRHLHQDGLNGIQFRGIKLYPPFGYSPNHTFMKPIWQYAHDNHLPVISHCMHSALTWNTNVDDGYGAKYSTLETYTAPNAYVNVLPKYPNTKICLAHFGGNDQWDVFIKKHNGKVPTEIGRHSIEYFSTTDFSDQDWLTQILQMLVSGHFPNLYVDTSFTFFERRKKGTGWFGRKTKKDNKMKHRWDHLKDVLMLDHRIRDHVLFGSDFYMSVQKQPSEDQFVPTMKEALGDDLFHQIAVTNPKKFLG